MKYLLIFFTLFFNISMNNYIFHVKEEFVFICLGGNSQRFHLTKKCKGLEKCSSEIQKITLKEAQNIGRTLCKYEF